MKLVLAAVAVPTAHPLIPRLASYLDAAAIGTSGFVTPADGFEAGDTGFLIGKTVEDL